MSAIGEQIRRRIEEVRSRVMARVTEFKHRLGIKGLGLISSNPGMPVLENIRSTVQQTVTRVRERIQEIRERLMAGGGLLRSGSGSGAVEASASAVKQPVLKEETVRKSIRTAL